MHGDGIVSLRTTKKHCFHLEEFIILFCFVIHIFSHYGSGMYCTVRYDIILLGSVSFCLRYLVRRYDFESHFTFSFEGILAIEIFQLRQKATSVISSLSRLGRNPSSAKYMESITLSKNQNKP
jgi:hypothetical protein